jgi:hypothetical protein
MLIVKMLNSQRWTEERKIEHSRKVRTRHKGSLFCCEMCNRRFYPDSPAYQCHMLFDHQKYTDFKPLDIIPVDKNAIIGYSMRKEIRAIKHNHRKNMVPARGLWRYSIRIWFNEIETMGKIMAKENNEVTFGSLLT